MTTTTTTTTLLTSMTTQVLLVFIYIYFLRLMSTQTVSTLDTIVLLLSHYFPPRPNLLSLQFSWSGPCQQPGFTSFMHFSVAQPHYHLLQAKIVGLVRSTTTQYIILSIPLPRLKWNLRSRGLSLGETHNPRPWAIPSPLF